MIDEVISRRIYLDSDKNEFATEEELIAESHAYACDRCITRTSPRKRTFYSSNDKRVYQTLDKSKVERYEAELSDKRHECYKRLPEICLKWYKDKDTYYYPIRLAKQKNTCGGKKLLCKYIYVSGWGDVRVKMRTILLDVVGLVRDIDCKDVVQCSSEEVAKLFDDERARIRTVLDSTIEEIQKRMENVKREYEGYINSVVPDVEINEDDYIFYDNDGKVIE